MAEASWGCAGIPGVGFDPHTLQAVVVDEAAAEAGLAAGNPAHMVAILLARGEVGAASALVADARINEPRNILLRVLDADCVAASGDLQRASTRLRALLKEFAGTPHEAVLQQHLGVVYYTMGDYHAAATRFRTALRLRTDAGAPQELLDASRTSLQAAVDRIAQAGPERP